MHVGVQKWFSFSAHMHGQREMCAHNVTGVSLSFVCVEQALCYDDEDALRWEEGEKMRFTP